LPLKTSHTLKRASLLAILLSLSIILHGAPEYRPPADSLPGSTTQQALAWLSSIKNLDSSRHWPHIDPQLLLDNLNASIRGPVKSFEGKNTNFCAYTAFSYLPLRYDPLGFARFVIALYRDGEATMGKTRLRPSKRVRNEAGLLRYKGELDINHLAQMWFLALADHFKGYLNFLNRRFHSGDENTMWAATNFAKFNRMLRRLFPYDVKARGSDLVRPRTKDIYQYLHSRLQQGAVFLYLNNRLLYRKNHEVSRFGIPTHYVMLTDIMKEGEKITIIYWDAGRKTLQQVTASFLNRIIYGISFCDVP